MQHKTLAFSALSEESLLLWYSSFLICLNLGQVGTSSFVQRRERVIRIFPGVESAHRLIGSLLVEQHETWAGQRYLDMD